MTFSPTRKRKQERWPEITCIIGGVENTRSARYARTLYVGNALTRGVRNTAVYLKEAVV